jgi:hypothetical protein
MDLKPRWAPGKVINVSAHGFPSIAPQNRTGRKGGIRPLKQSFCEDIQCEEAAQGLETPSPKPNSPIILRNVQENMKPSHGLDP